MSKNLRKIEINAQCLRKKEKVKNPNRCKYHDKVQLFSYPSQGNRSRTSFQRTLSMNHVVTVTVCW